ncbi:hypothetical protein FA15DRAFT_710528 [Coprinopsis marcescibilis]|uniref:Uncharacterized protein n=1 Tax=Coprinopsis marcescibilis TaxID=230819 RepID=A0A5C3KCB0_COPMA|nr:hypothetical protein FA15DRAFT_710528 [Coprinopsis marcescibilis]
MRGGSGGVDSAVMGKADAAGVPDSSTFVLSSTVRPACPPLYSSPHTSIVRPFGRWLSPSLRALSVAAEQQEAYCPCPSWRAEAPELCQLARVNCAVQIQAKADAASSRPSSSTLPAQSTLRQSLAPTLTAEINPTRPHHYPTCPHHRPLALRHLEKQRMHQTRGLIVFEVCTQTLISICIGNRD